MSGSNAARPRRRSVVADGPSSRLANLDLRQLRAHRDLLAVEDELVDYWTSLTQARIDGLAADATGESTLSPAQLVRSLGDTGSGRRRHTIAGQVKACRLPALPDVAHMWARDVDPHDLQLVADALAALQPAERQLIAYSTALHDLMDDSTRELIVRYRDNPRRALDALPAV